MDPRDIKCVFVGYSSTQKGYKCFIGTFFVSTNVTFFENESYFSSLYLQGETSSMEDKSVFLLDLSLSSSSYSSLYGETPKIVNVPLEPELESPEAKFLRESMGVDSSELVTTKPLPVYWRRKATIINPVQVQDFDLSPSNEVINASSSSLPESQGYTNIDLPEYQGYIDLDLPLAIRKAIRFFTRHPFSNFVVFNRFSPSH